MASNTGCAGLLLGLLVLLAGCKDEKKAGPAEATDPARDAAEQAIRSAPGAPAQMSFRGVQVYTQALPQHVAICGQVNPFADDRTIYVPFVMIAASVTIPDSPADRTAYKFEQYIGTTTAEAERVYQAIVNYCYDKGGPAAGRSPGVMPMAPLPSALPNPAVRNVVPAAPGASQKAAPAAVAGAAPASGSVTMRQNGNLHADPHGPPLRVISAGTVMHVLRAGHRRLVSGRGDRAMGLGPREHAAAALTRGPPEHATCCQTRASPGTNADPNRASAKAGCIAGASPVACSARYSPRAGECLKPCPEHGEAAITVPSARSESMMKPESGETV